MEGAVREIGGGAKEARCEGSKATAKVLTDLAAAVRGNTKLSSLALVDCGIDAAKFETHLTQCLEKHRALRHLDLSGNAGLGAQVLRPVLATVPLLSLVLRDCTVHALGAKSLAAVLRDDKLPATRSLQALDISHNLMGDSGCRELLPVVLALPALSSLNVANNGLGVSTARACAQALKGNTTLTHLDVSSNGLGALGSALILTELANCTALKKLNLSQCAMTGQGQSGAALAALVEHHTQLEDLDVSHNMLGPDCCRLLTPALIRNYSLKRLDASHNWMKNAGAEMLAYSKKPTLHLDVRFNGLDVNAVTDMDQYARRTVFNDDHQD